MKIITDDEKKYHKWQDLRFKFRKEAKDRLITFVSELILFKATMHNNDETEIQKIYFHKSEEFLELLDEVKKLYRQYPGFE